MGINAIENLKTGCLLASKKKHPCGGDKWILKHVGTEYTLECVKCGRTVTVNHSSLIKNFKPSE